MAVLAVAVGCALGALWTAPRVSSAVGAWLAVPPVRAAHVSLAPAAQAAAKTSARTVAAAPGAGDVALVPRAGTASRGGRAEIEGRVSPVAIDPGLRFNMVGFTCSRGAGRRPLTRYRVRAADGPWSGWTTLSFELVRGDDGVRRLVSDPQWVGSARYLEVRGPRDRTVRASVVNVQGDATAGDRAANALRRAALAVAGIAPDDAALAVTTRPEIVTRAEWGANESWRRSAPSYGTVRFAVVHHTASGNTYTRAQAPGVVRAVYYYHAKVCRFNDIGYNFLVDRYGTIYEGRKGGMTRAVQGAQALGFNSSSTGISVIGDFSAAPPPTAAVASLERLLAWKLDVHHVDPTAWVSAYCSDTDKFKGGTTVKVRAISGHRDVCHTTCPGDAFAATLPAVRKVVADTGLPKLYAFNAQPAVLSPNGDGSGDQTLIEFIASGPVDWSLAIAPAGGAPVRSFAGSGEAVSIAWDGTDEAGVAVPDGAYVVTGSAAGADGVARACRATVTVDTAVPEVTVEDVSPAVLNPSGGVVDIRTTVQYSLSESCTAKAIVRNAAGKAVEVLQGWTDVAAGTHSIAWDGRMTSGSRRVRAEDGGYRIEIAARDVAGNTVIRSAAVRVDRTLRAPVRVLALSPNGDGRNDTARLEFRTTRTADVSLAIVRSRGTVLMVSWKALAAGRHAFDWDGLWSNGKAYNGRYTMLLTASADGEESRGGATVMVDSKPPAVMLTRALTTVRRYRTAVATCRVADTLGPTATVTIVVRDSRKRVVARSVKRNVVVNKAWKYRLKPVRRGTWTVTFLAVDAAGNRQVSRALWRVRVR